MAMAYCLDLGGTVCCEIQGHMLEFEPSEPLSKLLRQLGQDAACFVDESRTLKLHPSVPLRYALAPGRILVGPPHLRQYFLKPYGSGKAVDGWLASLGMAHCQAAFERNGVDDFLVLPFLRPNILEDMGIASASDRVIIMRAVKRLQDLTQSQFVGLWLRHLGLSMYEDTFVKHRVGLRTIALLRESDFVRMGLNPLRTAYFFHATKYYREFSSAQATFTWLQWSRLARYAYQFARYQVPFYALPLVNFFIIDEMGVTNQDKALLSALQTLKYSPAYAVKAMAYWLRDLELDEYSLVFSKNLMVDFIESLTILNDCTINQLLLSNAARDKMKLAVREMKEVQFYYSASATLLQDLVLQKYSDVFAKHNVSIDNLPLLDDASLFEMGLTAEADRNAILAAVKKIKAELPSGALRLFYSNEPNLYQIDHKESAASPHLPKLDRGRCTPADYTRPRPEDTRSVEELLSFINGGTEPALGSSKHCPTTQLPGGASLPLARSPLQAFPSSLSGTVPLSSSPFPLSLSRPSPSPTLPNEAGPSVPSAKALRRARQRARRKLRSEQQAEPEETPPCSVDAASSRKATAGNPGKPPPTVTKTAQAGKRHLESSKTASSPGKAKHNSQKLAKELRHKSKNNRPLSVSTTAPNSLYQATKSSIKDVDPEEGLDPALEAQLDQEVEEFRLRLESHSASLERRPIPSSLRATLAQFNSRQLKPRSVK